MPDAGSGPAGMPGRPPLVSVLVPIFEQAAFIGRALASLQAQTLRAWEALIVDDGSEDAIAAAVAPFLADARIRYTRLARNCGLGHAVNVALDGTTAPLVAYLPADDVYYAEHLATLAGVLTEAPAGQRDGDADRMRAALQDPETGPVLAHSGLRHHYNRYSEGAPDGACLQLVQVMHRRIGLRWVERPELESDDLERLYWSRLRALGAVAGTGLVTCEWVDHPAQRHKLMQEPVGGINPFRRRYRVDRPLRFHTTTGNAIDETALYRRMRERPPTPRAPDALRIVLAGELAYNAERVLALEEAGHALYGLWMEAPYWYNTVGPLPFGHVEELPHDGRRGGWRDALRALRPDLIYAGLNWQAVPFAHEVMKAAAGIPFVWHFKEGPFICIDKGTWPELLDLYRHADGAIYCSPEMRDWFGTMAPDLRGARPSMVLDGDLPKRDWFEADAVPRLSGQDGMLHTVVPGRPIGLHPPDVAALGAHGIHLHFYGDFTHGQWREWIASARRLAPDHLHLHANVAQDRWVEEFSRYDAGWLHGFDSRNGGDIRRADWDDLNYPARMSTLAAAGLPMIQRDNGGALVATQALTRALDIGIFYWGIDDLAAQLRDDVRMTALRASVWRQRERFCFDTHVPALLAFFRSVIAEARAGPLAAR